MPTHRYRITISGGLDETAREMFEDLDIEPTAAGTVLTGDLDQAALLGVLNRIGLLGLELVKVSRQTDDTSLARGEFITASGHGWAMAKARLETILMAPEWIGFVGSSVAVFSIAWKCPVSCRRGKGGHNGRPSTGRCADRLPAAAARGLSGGSGRYAADGRYRP